MSKISGAVARQTLLITVRDAIAFFDFGNGGHCAWGDRVVNDHDDACCRLPRKDLNRLFRSGPLQRKAVACSGCADLPKRVLRETDTCNVVLQTKQRVDNTPAKEE